MNVSPTRSGTALVAVLIAFAGLHTQPTGAFYSDAQTVAANAFSSGSLAAPTGVSSTGACNGHLAAKVTTTWNSVANATAYEVWRATGSGSYSQIATPATTSYTDTTVVVNTAYHYKIRTERNNWRSVDSSSTNVSTPAVCP